MRRAVVLLSGGLDSATALAVAKRDGFEVFPLCVDYGQRHRHELTAAVEVAKQQGAAQPRVVTLDLRAIGGSALTADIPVPKDRPTGEMSDGIPVTYVPARNTILLGLALGYAETVGAFDLFIGAHIQDYSGYPDCRPAFLEAFAALANVATKAAVEGRGTFRVHSPLLMLTKADIIRLGTELGVDYALTSSCYDPSADGRACGRCDSCVIRRDGFAAAGVPDPTRYQE